MSAPVTQPLNEAEIDQLEEFLFSEAVSEDALDYPGLHGLLTAIAIVPVDVPTEEWLEVLFDGHPTYENDTQRQQIESLLLRELRSICDELEHEEAPDLPCDLTLEDEESLLGVWTQGFMEGVFMREETWFSGDEEQVAEMLLPMMVASELFDEEEFQQMRNDTKLCEQLCGEIPDLLTDLYLHFRVPAEPPKKTAGRGPKGRGKGRR